MEMTNPMEMKIQQVKSERAAEEEQSIQFEEDQMPMALLSQSPKPLNMVVPDDVKKSNNNCRKKVSFADEVIPSAMERARKIHLGLDPKFPSFVKSMLKSHVSGGFCLGLPSAFSILHLPKHDETITLIDHDNGDESKTKYLVDKKGLSAGWRGFSIAKKLVEGDALVFQLIEATKFKVYIVRKQGPTKVNVVHTLVQMEADVKPNDPVKAIKSGSKRHLPDVHLDSKKRNTDSPPISGPMLGLPEGQNSGSGSDEVVDSEVTEGIKFSGSNVEFKDVKSLESFTIMINGLIIDSEIPGHGRAKYYELCCSQNAFLHEHLLEGFNCKLVAGIISEIVNIADAIKASKISTCTSIDEYLIWYKSLKAFEQLGMNVGFLLVRLEQLIKLATAELHKYKEAITQQARALDEIRTLEDYIAKLKNASCRFMTEIETLKKGVKNEPIFQAEVNAA